MTISIYRKRHRSKSKSVLLWIWRRFFQSHDSVHTKQQKSKKLQFKLAAAIGLLIGICIAAYLYSTWNNPLVTPISPHGWVAFISNPPFLSLSEQSSNNKIVYGFLPYWNLESTTIQPEVTHLSYFGLNIGADGYITTRDFEGNLHPGYAKLGSDRLLELANQVNQADNQFEITLVQFETDTIINIINSEEAHKNLLSSIDSLLLSFPINGINIDIEYDGPITPELRNNFAALIEKISNHLHTKFDSVTLSIDMYASASNNKQLWDVPRIGKAVDYIVVMAYDFHRRSSPQAGPVAPLFGGKDKWDSDIHQNLIGFLYFVPKEKILLGIPFYGYGWQTESHLPQANTFPGTGATATYSRVKELLENPSQNNVITNWDEKALCPYLSYEKDGEIYMIYYENETSIGFKLEYVKKLDLAGIAIWALGYEGDDRELWDIVGKL